MARLAFFAACVLLAISLGEARKIPTSKSHRRDRRGVERSQSAAMLGCTTCFTHGAARGSNANAAAAFTTHTTPRALLPLVVVLDGRGRGGEAMRHIPSHRCTCGRRPLPPRARPTASHPSSPLLPTCSPATTGAQRQRAGLCRSPRFLPTTSQWAPLGHDGEAGGGGEGRRCLALPPLPRTCPFFFLFVLSSSSFADLPRPPPSPFSQTGRRDPTESTSTSTSGKGRAS